MRIEQIVFIACSFISARHRLKARFSPTVPLCAEAKMFITILIRDERTLSPPLSLARDLYSKNPTHREPPKRRNWTL